MFVLRHKTLKTFVAIKSTHSIDMEVKEVLVDSSELSETCQYEEISLFATLSREKMVRILDAARTVYGAAVPEGMYLSEYTCNIPYIAHDYEIVEL